MADEEEEVEETPSRGNEWEVVSLTASTYASAPSPKGFQSNDGAEAKDAGDDDEEASRALFMSDHFVFPPSQHENLPLEPDRIEHAGPQDPILDIEEVDKSYEKNEENLNVKGLTNELPGIQPFDENGKRLSVHGTEFAEGTALQGLNLVDDEQSLYEAAKFSSFHGVEDICDENTVIPEPSDPSERNLDSPDFLEPLSPTKEDKYNESGLPCGAWWKRQAASLYAHAKDANAFWSVFVAAALMGIIILGQRWQQERWQVQQLKWKLNITDEKMSRMLGSISRFKDVLVGGNRRGSVVRTSILAER